MTRKRMLRVLSFFTLCTGIICITLSLIFSYTNIGGYKGSVEVRQSEPYGWYQENERDYELIKLYWWKVCVNNSEPEYVLSVNRTLGTFSRGDIIELEAIFFQGEREGYEWNVQAYKVVDGQLISVPDQDAVIRRSYETFGYTGRGSVWLLENGNRTRVWLLKPGDFLQWIYFYVINEGTYALEIEGSANQPFNISIFYKIL